MSCSVSLKSCYQIIKFLQFSLFFLKEKSKVRSFFGYRWESYHFFKTLLKLRWLEGLRKTNKVPLSLFLLIWNHLSPAIRGQSGIEKRPPFSQSGIEKRPPFSKFFCRKNIESSDTKNRSSQRTVVIKRPIVTFL